MAGVQDGLRIRWSKREKALLYSYDGRGKPCGGMLSGVFEQTPMAVHYATHMGGDVFRTVVKPDRDDFHRTLVAELDARGYDVKTLRFSIRRKATP